MFRRVVQAIEDMPEVNRLQRGDTVTAQYQDDEDETVMFTVDYDAANGEPLRFQRTGTTKAYYPDTKIENVLALFE